MRAPNYTSLVPAQVEGNENGGNPPCPEPKKTPYAPRGDTTSGVQPSVLFDAKQRSSSLQRSADFRAVAEQRLCSGKRRGRRRW